jgi:hypothetical protein
MHIFMSLQVQHLQRHKDIFNFELVKGTKVEVLSGEDWWKASVLVTEKACQVKIHYKNGEKADDELIDLCTSPCRIRRPQSDDSSSNAESDSD